MRDCGSGFSMTNPFSAGPSALGYKYQFRWALLLLFKASSEGRTSEMSLERLDDVAFEDGDVAEELLQTKMHITPANLTDASVDLWKTLRVWCELTASDPQRVARAALTLITTATAPEGGVAAMLRPTGSRDAKAVDQKLHEVATQSENVSLQPAFASYLRLSETERLELLSRINVLDARPPISDIVAEIKQRFLIFSVQPQYVDDLYNALEGWWSRKTDTLLQNPSATIKPADLLSKLHDLNNQYSEHNLPDDFPKPLEMDESDLPEHQRYFVAQLKLVLNSNSRLRRAIGTYYRAYHQRSKWLDRGLITDDELERYEDYLTEEWTLEFERMHDEKGDLPDDETLRKLGLRLFDWSERNNFRTVRRDYLNGMFARGSLHILANSFKIGWHPEFRERLTDLMVKAAAVVS
jgi:hypothetical protein